MKKIVLFEDDGYVDLLPLTYWRSVFELRFGASILLDRAAQTLEVPISGVWTRDWIAKVAQQRCGAPANVGVDKDTVLINGRWIPEKVDAWPEAPAVGLVGDEIAYIVCNADLAAELTPQEMLNSSSHEGIFGHLPHEKAPGRLIRYPWDLVCGLADVLRSDWRENDAAIEAELDPRVTLESTDHIFIGRNTKIHPTAVIMAGDGPVRISENVKIGPHVVIEGPAKIGAGSVINPHAWIHGGNVIGPVCKVGGEIDGCVFQGFSNKQHDGFLGHCAVGSWVNLGAGTVNSDLKNTYGNIRVPLRGSEIDTGKIFFGAVIGDFVKTGINSTIPTGASIGFASVVAMGSVLPKFVPSFSWLTDQGQNQGDPERLLDIASKVAARRQVDLRDEEVELFLDIAGRASKLEST